jgi:hypothetical protein
MMTSQHMHRSIVKQTLKVCTYPSNVSFAVRLLYCPQFFVHVVPLRIHNSEVAHSHDDCVDKQQEPIPIFCKTSHNVYSVNFVHKCAPCYVECALCSPNPPIVYYMVDNVKSVLRSFYGHSLTTPVRIISHFMAYSSQ